MLTTEVTLTILGRFKKEEEGQKEGVDGKEEEKQWGMRLAEEKRKAENNRKREGKEGVEAGDGNKLTGHAQAGQGMTLTSAMEG